MKEIFKSSSHFVILDYSPTHSQLLIRSKKDKSNEYTVDIIFKGVCLLLLPTDIMGVEISLTELKDIPENLIERYDFKENKDFKVFCLKNNIGQEYFINAMCFGVYHNKLDIMETSIGRYDMEDLGENILWFNGD